VFDEEAGFDGSELPLIASRIRKTSAIISRLLVFVLHMRYNYIGLLSCNIMIERACVVLVATLLQLDLHNDNGVVSDLAFL
jgi:hypothetical protein